MGKVTYAECLPPPAGTPFLHSRIALTVYGHGRKSFRKAITVVDTAAENTCRKDLPPTAPGPTTRRQKPRNSFPERDRMPEHSLLVVMFLAPQILEDGVMLLHRDPVVVGRQALAMIGTIG